MIVAILLVGYAAAVGTGTGLLRRPWTHRGPRLAIVLWQLALATILAAALLGLLALTVPVAASSGLAGLLHACVMALRGAYRSPTSERLVFLLGLGLTAALITRIGGCLAAEWWRAGRDRRGHLDALALLGRPNPHPGPAAYCVPGRRRRIVLTTATLAALDAGQLAQVLRHERAHLAGRHDLILASARALARGVPLPVFRTAVRELSTLVEMLADDSAHPPQQRLTLAVALVNISSGAPVTPAVALAAAATDVLARVRRLLQPTRPLSHTLTGAAVLAGVLIALVPAAIAFGPAAVAVALPYCPVAPG